MLNVSASVPLPLGELPTPMAIARIARHKTPDPAIKFRALYVAFAMCLVPAIRVAVLLLRNGLASDELCFFPGDLVASPTVRIALTMAWFNTLWGAT